MKQFITLGLLLSAFFGNAQAFNGKGDSKFQVGANLQDNATGIMATYDYGLGENISIGIYTTYLLDTNNGYNATYDSKFEDRFDVKARFNANIGNVLGLPAQVDIYPGLNLGLRNFGAHLGGRYFFTNGFGVFTEFSAPIAKYESNVSGYDNLNNQFTFSLGASFNL